MAYSKSKSRGREATIFFLIGVLASALISGLIAETLQWSYAIVAVALVSLVAFTLTFVGDLYKRVCELLDRAETTIYYIEEPYNPEKGINNPGKVYEQVIEIVLEARKEVLVLTTSWAEGSRFQDLNPKMETKYLGSIEKAIRSRSGDGFSYVRVLQSPPRRDAVRLSTFVPSLLGHCKRVLDMSQRDGGKGKLNVDIVRVTKRMSSSFMIVDRRFLVVGLDQLDPEGVPFFAGVLIIDDQSGNIISKWRQHFQNLQIAGRRVTVEELSKELEKTYA